MAKTADNLMKMFSSGSESNIRYLAFAEAADKELSLMSALTGRYAHG